jgi:diaminohydroxyphosphoribosylaminopyrimidine deaminase/5-amino-6-(5-phosphoribosylamino)uracil reductase
VIGGYLHAPWMGMALDAARRGSPAPNPHVGAVVVVFGQCVGVGWHARAGEPHAEILALRAAGARARGATLYVTLEPCNHYGRTPPCAEAILDAGLARVVVGCRDPNPHVTGHGVERLRAAGVDVETGVLGGECLQLISAWNPVRHGKPQPVARASQGGRVRSAGTRVK